MNETALPINSQHLKLSPSNQRTFIRRMTNTRTYPLVNDCLTNSQQFDLSPSKWIIEQSQDFSNGSLLLFHQLNLFKFALGDINRGLNQALAVFPKFKVIPILGRAVGFPRTNLTRTVSPLPAGKERIATAGIWQGFSL